MRLTGPTGLARRVIPCLDVSGGRVVKGVRFESLRDQGDPAESALRYAEQGADEIVFLDITASHEKRDLIFDIASRVAEEVFIPFTVGGGIRTVDDFSKMLKTGADKCFVNSAAFRTPQVVREAADKFGSQCVVVAIDAKRTSGPDEPGAWEVYLNGGRVPTGHDAVKWAETAAELGAGEILLTSMDRDGTKDGYDIDLLRAVRDVVPVPIVASGGAGNVKHMADAVIKGGADAVLAASIFHFGEASVADAKRALARAGAPVRLTEGVSA